MMPDPSTGWTVQARLRERLLAYVRDEHPGWLPRQRVIDAGRDDQEHPDSTVRAAGTS